MPCRHPCAFAALALDLVSVRVQDLQLATASIAAWTMRRARGTRVGSLPWDGWAPHEASGGGKDCAMALRLGLVLGDLTGGMCLGLAEPKRTGDATDDGLAGPRAVQPGQGHFCAGRAASRRAAEAPGGLPLVAVCSRQPRRAASLGTNVAVSSTPGRDTK